MRTKLFILFILLSNFYSSFSQSEVKQSVLISPFSIFGGRLNTKYEKITQSHLTYGGRFEILLVDKDFDKHMWIAPYGRYYPFSKEATGLYAEGSLFYRVRYSKSEGYNPNEDYFNSNGGARLMLGGQWWSGKKTNIPFDIGIGLNIDLQNLENNANPSAIGLATSIVGPLNIFCFRIQTGIGF